ncbi:MAG: parB-like partition protein [Candidatus Saccharibacteria bacterium]|jgi:ParB family chromosome partitioning protein|nr:parB-like partition protein [Candidatus Saccharibacteria bacterium]
MAEKTRGLGRGLDSLIPTAIVEDEFDVTAKVDEKGHRTTGEEIELVAVELVDPNPHQPRTVFDESALQALAASIRVHGILQPLVGSKVGGRYELIAGERRLRAAKIAGLDRVPMIVRTFDEQSKLELALLENLQRADLNPIELATAYKKLNDQFNLSLSQIGSRIGKSVPTISNTMRLLRLPLDAKRALVDLKITEGHARVLLTFENEKDKMLEMLDMIIRKHWNVRQTEEFARGWRGEKGSKMLAQARIKEESALSVELANFLGAKVIQKKRAKGGRLIIDYYSEEELDRIYRTIKGENQ